MKLTFLNADDFAHLALTGLPSESGQITGGVVYLIQKFARSTDVILLAGDRNSTKEAYSRIAGVPPEHIITAGLHEEMDFRWDYDEPAPDMERVDMVVSHAMIEHIVDPYAHIRNCYMLLNPGGHLVVHTVMPGFVYHRFPHDCLRFHPDWFEAVAARLGARVAERMIDRGGQIIYCIERPQ